MALRSHGSSGGTNRARMVLAAVLLLSVVAETRGRSQLSIVHDIDKSLENILQDVQSLQQFITTTPGVTSTFGYSTTSENSTPSGTSDSSITSETSPDSGSSSSSVIFTSTSTGISSRTSTGLTTSSESVNTTQIGTTTASPASSTTKPSSVQTTSSSATTPTTSTPITTPSSTTTSSTTTPRTTTSTIPTTSTTTASITTTTTTPAATTTTTTTTPTTTTTATIPITTTTSTTTTTTTSPTTTTTTTPTTTTTTTPTTTTTTTPTTTSPPSTTTLSTTSTTTTTTHDPSGPLSNSRVKRWNPPASFIRSNALGEGDTDTTKESITTTAETSDAPSPSDITEATMQSSETSETPVSEETTTFDTLSSDITVLPATTNTPVPDFDRLEAALEEVDQVVQEASEGPVTEGLLERMQAAEAEVKDVTDSPDEDLVKRLQEKPALLDSVIEDIQNDQAIVIAKEDSLENKKTYTIVGSVLGGVLLIAFIVLGAVFYMRQKKKKEAGGKATSKKSRQSATPSGDQQMVELGAELCSEDAEYLRPTIAGPNARTGRTNLDNFSTRSSQRRTERDPERAEREPPEQRGEASAPGIENGGFTEELPPRPIVPPKPRKSHAILDKFSTSPGATRSEQEPNRADFGLSEHDHYIDELNSRLVPRDEDVRHVGGNYYGQNEPKRRSHRDRSPRHQPKEHRSKHKHDHVVRETPPHMPLPDYTMPRNTRSYDNFIARKPHSQKQRPYIDFEPPQGPVPPPMAHRPERDRRDIRRPYGPEDIY